MYDIHFISMNDSSLFYLFFLIIKKTVTPTNTTIANDINSQTHQTIIGVIASEFSAKYSVALYCIKLFEAIK